MRGGEVSIKYRMMVVTMMVANIQEARMYQVLDVFICSVIIMHEELSPQFYM